MSSLIEKLRADHDTALFDCGRVELNRFLQKDALNNIQAGGAQTYVGIVNSTIVGYYALAVGSVVQAVAPDRVKRGMAKHDMPIMLLARLAVDKTWQRKGVGAGLLKDAALRTLQAADIAGIRALVVHAKDSDAQEFCRHFDFISSPTDPLHLFILLKDLRAWQRPSIK